MASQKALLVAALSILLFSVFTSYCFTADINRHYVPCAALSLLLHDKVSYPHSTPYTTFLGSYFSKQEEGVTPACIVTPTSSHDVATAIKTLAGLNLLNNNVYQFAIKSGGHTTFAGSSNIEDGVTIDLASLNEINVSLDRTVTSLGPGNRWQDVYYKLDAMNFAVAGGRDAQVGVGGLLLGGGMSYFGPRTGFACDNVVNHEIVLANGEIVNVNATSSPDLWLALKGGSNNFGVVTRFDVRSFEQGRMWGGSIYYDISTVAQQLEAFANFDIATAYDEYAVLIQSFGFSSTRGMAAVNGIEYTKPVANPAVFHPFTSIQPQLASTMRISNLTDLTIEQGAFSPDGFRQIMCTTTFKKDLAFLKTAYSMFNATVAQIAGIRNVTWSLTFQPIPPAITAKSAAYGGNSLGLEPADGPLVLVLLAATWSLIGDDDKVNHIARTLIDDLDQAAVAKGVFNKFKYLNYALDFQLPIDGYGLGNKVKLQSVSHKYDPHQMFQQAVPGGFKLFVS